MKATEYAAAIEQVLQDRGLISGPIPWLAWAGPEFYGCDAYGFEIDMDRFRVKRLEALHSEATIKAISAHLKGIKVSFANTQGFAYLVKCEPVTELLSFSDQVPLPEPPEKNYLIPFGVTKEGKEIWRSIWQAHNIAVGGQTQYGKTTGFFAWYTALTKQHPPAELQMAIIDGKKYEFNSLNGSPYLIAEIAIEANLAMTLTEQIFGIVRQRQQLFKQHRVGTLELLTRKTGQRLPVVILLVDEVKDLIDAGFDQTTLNRILQQGVGVGVFVVEGTQKPDRKTINQTNFNTFVAYRLSNVYDSQIIFGNQEAYHILKNSQPGELVAVGPDLNMALLKGFWVEKHLPQNGPTLSQSDRILVAIAIKKFDGYCPIDRMVELIQKKLPARYGKLFTKHILQKTFADWEAAGWLEPAKRQDDGSWLARRVTDYLRQAMGV